MAMKSKQELKEVFSGLSSIMLVKGGITDFATVEPDFDLPVTVDSLNLSQAEPTLNRTKVHGLQADWAVTSTAGDITFALGYRTMVSILEFIRTIDKVVEGFANPDNLLYAPEIKFYSNKVIINEQFETNIKGLYSIGDGGGMTRGLMMASCSGIQMARNL